MKRLIIKSIIYWYCALTLLGIIVTVRGDCALDQTSVDACVAGARRLSFAGLVVAAIGYVFFIRRPARHKRD